MTIPNSYNRGSIRCYYCFNPTHIKPNCAKLTEDKEKGRCHLGENGKLYIGRPGEGKERVWIQRRSNMFETDAVGRAFLNFNPQSVTGARFITVTSYPEDDTEKELEDEFQTIKIHNYTAGLARVNTKEVPKKNSIPDPKYKILKRDEERKYVTPKHMRFRNYVNAADSKKPVISSANLKNDIDLSDASQKKAEKPARLETTLKDLGSEMLPATVVNRMLDSSVALTWREILSISDPVRKMVFKRSPDLQQVSVRNLEIDGKENERQTVWTVLASSKAPIRIERNSKKYKALLDTSAEMNLISEDI